MKNQSIFGVAVGVISIIFSVLCFAVTAVFTAAIVLAVIFGAFSGGIALALKARRTAVVTFVFALTPLCGFLILEHVVERVRTGYVVFTPLVLATAFAVWMLIGHARAKRLAAGSAT